MAMDKPPLNKDQLLAAIEKLDPKDAYLLKLRFGFIDDAPRSIGELARIYNLEIDQMLEKLRKVESLAQAKLRKL